MSDLAPQQAMGELGKHGAATGIKQDKDAKRSSRAENTSPKLDCFQSTLISKKTLNATFHFKGALNWFRPREKCQINRGQRSMKCRGKREKGRTLCKAIVALVNGLM